MKVYTPRFRHDRASIEHQEREFALLQKLKHENIVKMLAIEEEVNTILSFPVETTSCRIKL